MPTNNESKFDLEVIGFRVFLNDEDKIVITQECCGETQTVVLDRASAQILAQTVDDFLVADLLERADELLAKQ